MGVISDLSNFIEQQAVDKQLLMYVRKAPLGHGPARDYFPTINNRRGAVY